MWSVVGQAAAAWRMGGPLTDRQQGCMLNPGMLDKNTARGEKPENPTHYGCGKGYHREVICVGCW